MKEDGAVRPEENTALPCLLFSVSVRKRHVLDCDPQISRIIYCPTDLTRPGGQHSQNFVHQDDDLTPVGKCSRLIDDVKCQEECPRPGSKIDAPK